MPTLQRVVAHTVKDTTYYKWQVVLPADAIEELGWGEGDELEATAEDGTLVLRPPSSA